MRLVKPSKENAPPFASPYAQLPRKLEAKAVMKTQHCMSNAIILLIKEEDGEAEGERRVVGDTSGEKGSCGHCHSRQCGATR